MSETDTRSTQGSIHSNGPVTLDTCHLRVDGQPGTWSAHASVEVEGQEFFLMASEQAPSHRPEIIVDTRGRFVTTADQNLLSDRTLKEIKRFLHHGAAEKKPSLRSRLEWAQVKSQSRQEQRPVRAVPGKGRMER